MVHAKKAVLLETEQNSKRTMQMPFQLIWHHSLDLADGSNYKCLAIFKIPKFLIDKNQGWYSTYLKKEQYHVLKI